LSSMPPKACTCDCSARTAALRQWRRRARSILRRCSSGYATWRAHGARITN
jgi:hypothetical protein